jgi:hypothetical protein
VSTSRRLHTALRVLTVLSRACPCARAQEHGTILRMLMSSKTAQPAAATPLALMEEVMAQLEKLAGANLKGGVFQGGQGCCAACWVWVDAQSQPVRDACCDVHKPVACCCGVAAHTEDDTAVAAKARRNLAAGMCKRLQELLQCLHTLLRTVIANPAIIDHQVRLHACVGGWWVCVDAATACVHACEHATSDTHKTHAMHMTHTHAHAQTRTATRAYKLLTTLAKAYQLPKKGPAVVATAAAAAAAAAADGSAAGAGAGAATAAAAWGLSAEFEALVVWVHKELSPAVSEALKDSHMASVSRRAVCCAAARCHARIGLPASGA